MSVIAAISTATGSGGIGIIRMSGKDSFKILEKIFKTKNKIDYSNIQGYTMRYGHVINNKTNEVIDEVLVSFFKEDKSYTKENMCEINSHGGIVVERLILEECLKNGANLAEPGEFTKRAFLNGRIDLSQAESIIDIINSKTEKEAKASINQLEGELSKKIGDIKHKLLNIMADIEATIDYPEYDLEEVTNQRTIELIYEVNLDLNKLEESFSNGKLLKEGIRTAIIGKPNTGKSSLLNAILNEERAIVSDIEGTTRDTIEEFITIKGIPLKIIDTAGIRNTEDTIEKIGVKKALEISKEADLIIAIFDNTKELEEDDYEILDLIKDKKSIVLINKIDITTKNNIENEISNKINKKIIKISAQKREGLDCLYETIEEMFKINEIEVDNGIIITNVRHKNQISLAIKDLAEARKSIENNMPIDIISIYIKQCLEDLGYITGENISEDIIKEIFSKFCLGK